MPQLWALVAILATLVRLLWEGVGAGGELFVMNLGLVQVLHKEVFPNLRPPPGCVKFPKSFRNFTASGFSAGV